MRLAPNDDQIEVLAAVSDVLGAEAAFDRWYAPGLDVFAEEDRILSMAAEMGWFGMAASEAVGGSGGDLVDECLIMERLGRSIAPIGVIAEFASIHLALASQQEALAGGIINGSTRIGLGAALADGKAFGVHKAQFVLEADGAGLTLRPILDVRDVGVALDASSSSGSLAVGDTICASNDPALYIRYQLLIAAMLSGLARTACEESNAYAKMREQFGRPIGSFQAVRHRIADMEQRVRQAEAQLYFAAVAQRDRRGDMRLQTLCALLQAGDAAMSNAEANIHNHGAIGTTTENIGHLLLKRAILLKALVGGTSHLADEIAECAPAIM